MNQEVIDNPAHLEVTQAIVKRKPGTFLPGQPSANPKGRPRAGAAVAEWFNIMVDWTEDQINVCLKDKTKTRAKHTAALCWKYACSEDKNASGNRIAGPELERIFDRTIGKAMQQVEVTHLDPKVLDLTRLDSGEVAALRSLLSKATGRALESNVSALPDAR